MSKDGTHDDELIDPEDDDDPDPTDEEIASARALKKAGITPEKAAELAKGKPDAKPEPKPAVKAADAGTMTDEEKRVSEVARRAAAQEVAHRAQTERIQGTIRGVIDADPRLKGNDEKALDIESKVAVEMRRRGDELSKLSDAEFHKALREATAKVIAEEKAVWGVKDEPASDAARDAAEDLGQSGPSKRSTAPETLPDPDKLTFGFDGNYPTPEECEKAHDRERRKFYKGSRTAGV